jgi:hypothetical protein
LRELRDGEPCSHKGCLSHISHPCEGCGRIAGKNIPKTRHVLDNIEERLSDMQTHRELDNDLYSLINILLDMVYRLKKH